MIKINDNDISKSLQRIGSTLIENMQWILRFAQYDLNSLTTGDWINLHLELSAFQLIAGDNALDVVETPIGYIKRSSPTNTEIIEFQLWILNCIDRILKKETIKILLPTFTISLSPPSNNTTKPWIKREASKDLWAITKHATMSLFSEFAHKIRRCPGCSTLFLADRKNQSFCSRNCQSRVKMREIKGITPERYGKHNRKK